jgi:diaminopimelate epimerase
VTRRLPFVKMHGAGNDFLMVAAEDLDSGRPLDRERIAFLCDRRRGVGADGLIVIGPAAGADFGMVYYNSDGGEASMCGNGARCAFAFARARGLIDREGTCASASGALRGRCEADGLVSVDLTPPRGLALAVAAAGAHPFGELHRADTGVPHLVVPVDDVDAVDLPRWGARAAPRRRLRSRRDERQLRRPGRRRLADPHLRAGRGGRDPGLRHPAPRPRPWCSGSWGAPRRRSPC